MNKISELTSNEKNEFLFSVQNNCKMQKKELDSNFTDPRLEEIINPYNDYLNRKALEDTVKSINQIAFDDYFNDLENRFL